MHDLWGVYIMLYDIKLSRFKYLFSWVLAYDGISIIFIFSFYNYKHAVHVYAMILNLVDSNTYFHGF